jgi:hypothetical protein
MTTNTATETVSTTATAPVAPAYQPTVGIGGVPLTTQRTQVAAGDKRHLDALRDQFVAVRNNGTLVRVSYRDGEEFIAQVVSSEASRGVTGSTTLQLMGLDGTERFVNWRQHAATIAAVKIATLHEVATALNKG